jgi:polysaccharide pyruvyl transferase WcaK-like protein
MRVVVTGIPSYLIRTVEKVLGTTVKHKPYFSDVRTKTDLIKHVKQIANTGNYLIGEGAAHSLRNHDVTYIPFWHFANQVDSDAVYEKINQEFDMLVFASANLLRPGYSADMEARVFEKINIPVVVMGIGIQRKGKLDDELPQGTIKFLNVLKSKTSYFLTRGYFTADFLKSFGMKYVRPTGCPSLYFSPGGVRQSLSRLADPELAEAQRIAFGGYLGSVADTIVDANALLRPESTAAYVLQDEIVVYNVNIAAEEGAEAYDQNAGRIVAPTDYKHADKWKCNHDLLVFFDTNRWRTWVAQQDLCLGRRFHGCVIGMQAGVPSLMIAVDDRMREMLEFVGFPHIEATIWNREGKKKQYLRNFLSEIDVSAALDRYGACENNFRSTLREIGLH